MRFCIDDRVLSVMWVPFSGCAQQNKPDVMHDRGLLLVVTLGDIHKTAPVSELESIIAQKKMLVSRKNIKYTQILKKIWLYH